uniref:Uncharacterized protein n=1 Tax=Pipistrellus kuhlii TaxID=59472 RepID=A0A7J7Y9B7_PIPKU|nr:hypothetical protein mPipKuh1_010302 [Pipistrellus kuhlii]
MSVSCITQREQQPVRALPALSQTTFLLENKAPPPPPAPTAEVSGVCPGERDLVFVPVYLSLWRHLPVGGARAALLILPLLSSNGRACNSLSKERKQRQTGQGCTGGLPHTQARVPLGSDGEDVHSSSTLLMIL